MSDEPNRQSTINSLAPVYTMNKNAVIDLTGSTASTSTTTSSNNNPEQRKSSGKRKRVVSVNNSSTAIITEEQRRILSQRRGKPIQSTKDATTATTAITNTTQTINKKSNAIDNFKKNAKCSFCNVAPAAVYIQKRLTQQPFCLLHYYTTRASRIDPTKVHPIRSSRTRTSNTKEHHHHQQQQPPLEMQLSNVQELFSEAFLGLQKDIDTEAALSISNLFDKSGNDPLSLLRDAPLSTTRRKRKTLVTRPRGRPPSAKPKMNSSSHLKIMEEEEGGFLQGVKEREVTLMRQQVDRIRYAAQESHESFLGTRTSISSSNSSSTIRNPSIDVTRRRKTKSSWNKMIMSNQEDKNQPSVSGSGSSSSIIANGVILELKNENKVVGMTCSCGSNDIEIYGNITNRNNDVRKAEIWGTKQENDMTTRYRCNNCARIWNEDE